MHSPLVPTITQVVLYHDPVAHNLYISDDEGAKWNPIPDVPSGEAHIFIEHPYNNRIVRPFLL